MGRRSAIILILAVFFMFSTTSVFADVSISKERTTVTNLLPDITIYMDPEAEPPLPALEGGTLLSYSVFRSFRSWSMKRKRMSSL